MNTYKLGLVSVSFRKYSPEEIIIAAKKAGLECIEWGSDIHAPAGDTDKLKNIAELQKKHGISCCSYGTYFTLGTTDLNELENYIHSAKILGTNVLRVWCGKKSKAEHTEAERNRFIEECKKAAKIAEENDAYICMECHNWSYTETLDGALDLMNAVNSPNFLMYWQPNQFKDEDTNLKYAEAISPYCKVIHAFNWKGDNRFSLAEGTEIWRKYLNKLKNIKTVLLEFMPDDKIESLETEAKALCEITNFIHKEEL